MHCMRSKNNKNGIKTVTAPQEKSSRMKFIYIKSMHYQHFSPHKDIPKHLCSVITDEFKTHTS